MPALSVYFIFNGFLLLMGIYLFIKTTPDLMKKKEYYVFKTLIIAYGYYIVMNSIWTMQEYDIIQLPKGLFKVVCLASLTGVMLNTFCFYKFLMVYYGYTNKRVLLYEFFGFLPFFVMFILLVISIWTGFVFSVSDELNIIQGDGYIMLPIVAFIYFVIILVCTIVELVKTKSPQSKKNLINILLITVFLIGWVVFDNFFDGVTIIPIVIFMVLFIIFVTFQQASINTDALTQMNNRRKAMEYLTSQIESVSPDAPIYLYICDINLFKSINDNYGHVEGDNALVILSDAIKEVVGTTYGFAARYGGDEFIIAIRPQKYPYDEKEILERIDDLVRSKCILLKKPYEIAIASGLVICRDRTATVESYIKEADMVLYENKKNNSLLGK